MLQPFQNDLPSSPKRRNFSFGPPVFYAFQLLVIITLAVFLAEARGFLHLPFLYGLSSHTEMFLHTLITTLLVFPFLFLLSYLPMIKQIERSTRAESELQRAKETIEMRIQESTAELLAANQSLQNEIARRSVVEQRLRLHTAALESAANGIVITDKQGSIEWCNPAFAAMTGYQPEEVLGRSLSFLKSGMHVPAFYQQLWATITTGKVWRGETINRRKDGSLYTEEQTITPLLNPSAEIAHYIAIKNDITQRKMAEAALELERKQAEERLMRSNQELELASQAERKQRQLAESLVQATLALNTSLDPDLVLDRILEQIQRVIPSAITGVLLFDDDKITLARSRGLEQVNGVLAQMLDGMPLSTMPLIQQICQERRARVFVDTQQELKWNPFPGLEWVHSMILVPLITVDQAVGMIGLVSDRPGFYQPEHLEPLQAFATPAVLAIQNAQLFQQVQAGRERLQWLSRRLVDVQEQERRWIARELHDEAGQALTSLKVGLRLLERQAQDPLAVCQAAVELNQVADSVLENLHRLAMDLRPASLDHLGLAAALRQHIETLAEQHEMQFNYDVIDLEQRLPPEVETTLYRIVQEALTNIIRHAHATQVDVLLERRDKKVIALIEDNGVGFDPQPTLQNNRLGLLGMRERVEMLGGQLAVESQPGEGTAIFVEVPLDD